MNKTDQRDYRGGMGQRFSSFLVVEEETDIWVGVPESQNSTELRNFSYSIVKALRGTIEEYISNRPDFQESLSPIGTDKNIDPILNKMILAAQQAQTGPMAGVAGAFAHVLGKELVTTYDLDELIIENGGDNYIDINSEVTCSIFAGESPLSEKIGFKILPKYSPLGICTSSGSFGPSKSLGEADAVAVAAKNTILADCYATAIANKVNSGDEIQQNIEIIKEEEDLVAGAIIKDEKIAVAGELELQLLDK